MNNNTTSILTPLYESNKGISEENISKLIGEPKSKENIISGLTKIFDVAKELNAHAVYARGDVHRIYIGVPDEIRYGDLEKTLSEEGISFANNWPQAEVKLGGEDYSVGLIYRSRHNIRDPTIRATWFKFFNPGKTHTVVHRKKISWIH